jgi:hypothetical protein
MREPNAIDFWRGFALVTIFINHIPGNTFERYTYSQVSISDAAELFVFLAGWSIALAVRRHGVPEPAGRVLLRLASRTLEVYRAQLVITAIAIAMIAAAALALDNPLILEWHNAGPVFSDPIQTTIGWVLLTHQLGYFNILPLYVGLLALAPIFVLIARLSRVAALGGLVPAVGGVPCVADQPAVLADRGKMVLQPAVLAVPARARVPGLRMVARSSGVSEDGVHPSAACHCCRGGRIFRDDRVVAARSDDRPGASPPVHL